MPNKVRENGNEKVRRNTNKPRGRKGALEEKTLVGMKNLLSGWCQRKKERDGSTEGTEVQKFLYIVLT